MQEEGAGGAAASPGEANGSASSLFPTGCALAFSTTEPPPPCCPLSKCKFEGIPKATLRFNSSSEGFEEPRRAVIPTVVIYYRKSPQITISNRKKAEGRSRRGPRGSFPSSSPRGVMDSAHYPAVATSGAVSSILRMIQLRPREI